MDYGFGYKNWDSSLEYNGSPSSLESSPPTYSSDPYGFGAPQNRIEERENETYEYDIDDRKEKSRGDKKRDNAKKKSIQPKAEEKAADARRLSVEERKKAILERNKVPAAEKKNSDDPKQPESDQWTSWLVQGIEPSSEKPSAPSGAQRSRKEEAEEYEQQPGDSDEDDNAHNDTHSVSDSFELSAADLEVGAYAARMSKEKATARHALKEAEASKVDTKDKDMSVSELGIGIGIGVPRSGLMSPDIQQQRPNAAAATTLQRGEGMGMGGDRGVSAIGLASHMSSALSSIRGGPAEVGDGVLRFGSVNMSSEDEEGNLYKRLAGDTRNPVVQGVSDHVRSSRYSDTGTDFTMTNDSDMDLDMATPLPLHPRTAQHQQQQQQPSLEDTQETYGEEENDEYSDDNGDDDDDPSRHKGGGGVKSAAMDADYSLDDFEAISQDLTLTVAAAVQNKPMSPVPVIESAEDMSRRKALEAIKDRWLHPNPNPTIVVAPDPISESKNAPVVPVSARQLLEGKPTEISSTISSQISDIRTSVASERQSFSVLPTLTEEDERSDHYTPPPSPPPSPPPRDSEENLSYTNVAPKSGLAEGYSYSGSDRLPSGHGLNRASGNGLGRPSGMLDSGTPPPPPDEDFESQPPYQGTSTTFNSVQSGRPANESTQYVRAHSHSNSTSTGFPTTRRGRIPSMMDDLDFHPYGINASTSDGTSRHNPNHPHTNMNTTSRDRKLVTVVAPSRQELLAHLATLTASSAKRSSRSLMKDNNNNSFTGQSHQSQQSPSSSRDRKSRETNDVTSAPKWAALNRSEQSASRLQRQVEELGKELRSLKIAAGHQKAVLDGDRGRGGGDHRPSTTATGRKGTTTSSSRTITTPPGALVKRINDVVGHDVVTSKMQEIIAENHRLAQKERWLETRLSVLETREELLQLKDKDKDQNLVQGQQQQKIFPITKKFRNVAVETDIECDEDVHSECRHREMLLDTELSELRLTRRRMVTVGVNTSTSGDVEDLHLHMDCRERQRELEIELSRLRQQYHAVLEAKANETDRISHTDIISTNSDTNHNTRKRDEEILQLEKIISTYQLENERLIVASKRSRSQSQASDVDYTTGLESELHELREQYRIVIEARSRETEPNHNPDSKMSTRDNSSNGTGNPFPSSSSMTSMGNLRLEMSNLEKMLRSYHVENKRLLLWKKSKEEEEKSSVAKFLQERDALNSEIHHLRNLLSVSADGNNVITQRASGSKPTVWATGLTADDVYGPRAVEVARSEAKKAQEDLENERERSRKEKGELLSRLRFFTETQPLLSEITTERDSLLTEVKTLRKEFSRRGIDWKQTTTGTGTGTGTGGAQEGSHLLDDSSLSNGSRATLSSSSGRGGGGKTTTTTSRNVSDMKRIKELETALQIAQESLRRRFPDSIANLVQVASIAETESSAAVAAARNKVDSLQKDMVVAEELHAMSLRALRQVGVGAREYERLRMQYEDRIKEMESQLLLQGEQRQHQHHQLRGTVESSDDTLVKVSSSNRTALNSESSSSTHNGRKRSVTLQNNKNYDIDVDVENRVEDLQQKLNMVKTELLRTAEELGREKASREAAVRAMAEVRGHDYGMSVPVPVTSFKMPEEEMPSLARQLLQETMNHNNALSSQIATLTAELMEKREKASEKGGGSGSGDTNSLVLGDLLRAERDRFDAYVRQEHDATSRLQAEVFRLESELQNARQRMQAPPTPQMARFLTLESQIIALEERLRRRDAEMQSAVEESRAAGRIERARLQAIHMQELREKDEQLVRFQDELQSLVITLRKQSQTIIYSNS
eukprot:gene1095-2129_t